MMELVSIHVENFRSFSEGTFSPLGLGVGMTAINGGNGRGKSSIVAALAWALYGVTPDGVAVKALRRQGSDGDVRATVTFRHQGQTIVVSRALVGKKDTTVASIVVDGVEETSVSSKTATLWVTKRIGLDAEAFFTAYVVRQKELDSLVKARPAERRKTIERLAGIERMSAALELARADARAATRLRDALPDGDDPEEAEAARSAAAAALDEAEAVLSEARITANDAVHAAKAAEQRHQDARALTARLTEARHNLRIATGEKEHAEEELTRVQALSEAEDPDVALAAVQAADEALQSAEAAIREEEYASRTFQTVRDQANQAAARAETASSNAQRLAKQVHDLQTRLAEFPTDLSDQVTAATETVNRLADERGATRGEWERLSKAINTLSCTDDTAACPTCTQALTDPSGLLSTLTETLTSVTRRGQQITKEHEAAQATLETLMEQVRQSAATKDRLDTAVASLENLTATAEEAHTVAEKAAAALADAETAQEDAAQRAAEAHEARTGLIQAASEARKRLAAAEAAAQARAAVPALTDAVAETRVRAEEAQVLVDALERDVEALPVDDAERAARTAAEKAAEAREGFAVARGHAEVATERARAAEQALQRAVSDGAARKAAALEVEEKTSVASALEEFRRDRLARLAPELSEVASDFISRMTDGKFTTVEFDEDFTPTLTERSGALRPVSWLSGGEESVVALAMRIAIGEILSGQHGGLLVLDEVLTAQDPERRTAVMAAIRTLPRQVVTINHVSEATDMVDLVAEVIDDGEGASTIREFAPDSASQAFMSDQDSIDASEPF